MSSGWYKSERYSSVLTEDASAGTATVSHTYADPGTYEVHLTLSDDDGGSASQVVGVQVTGEGES